MPGDEFSKRILKHVSGRQYRPQAVRALAVQLDIDEEDLEEFERAVAALHRDGRIILGEGRVVIPPELSGKIIGTYRAHRRGFGFITPESPNAHGDLFVPPGHQMTAVTGDTVLARVTKKGKRRGEMAYEGRILDILERGRSQFVGRLERRGGRWLVMPEGRTLHVPIFVPDAGASAAGKDDQVVVEIIQYPSADDEAQGVIVDVIGPHGEPHVDTLSIIRQFHLPHEFPEACVEEARRMALSFRPAAVQSRLDLRERTVITIDPDDARDFDDAVSLTCEDQQWELGVHIADVSHFVEADSPLDAEARLRGNSVYLPGQVIPMLPEVLSNGVCSLQEGQPRLTKSVFVRYDSQGHVLGQQAANSLISSSKRLTYRQASMILEGKTGGFSHGVVELLQDMQRLARIIQQRRMEAGMLSLDLPGVELVLDDSGRLLDVRPEDQSFSHTVIEMFMVEANEAVARLLSDLRVEFLRRIHPDPEPHAREQLEDFLGAIGQSAEVGTSRHKLQHILDSVRGRPEAFSVNLAILRSMAQAEYSPQHVGHFALASEHYCHFTSPIRRYADLTVHRLLDAHLAGRRPRGSRPAPAMDHHTLQQLARHCSFTDRRAEDAEWDLRRVKIMRFLSQHLGESLRGRVSGVAEFGVFVQLEKYLIEGLIQLQHLPRDDWTVVPEAGCLIGQRTQRRIAIGDEVMVTITRVDVVARQMDLHLDRQLSRRSAARTEQRRKKKKKRKPRSKRQRSDSATRPRRRRRRGR